MDRRKIDVVLATLLILVSVIILTSDSLVEGGAETDLGSMFLPCIVAGFIILFAGTMGVQSLLSLMRGDKPEGQEIIPTEGMGGVAIYIGLFIGYWYLVPLVGFLICTPIVMFCVAWLLGGRNLPVIGAMSIITPLLVFYGANHFLRVFLPTWSLS